MRNIAYKSLLVKYLVPLLYTVLFYFVQIEPKDGSYWQVILLLAGFYLGNLFLWMDNAVLYSKYNELQTLPKQLITRSILFILAYVVLAIFMVTSVGTLLGTGIVLGIGVSLSIEMWLLRHNYDYFQKTFLYQVQRQLTPLEISRMVICFILFVVFIALYFLFRASV